MLCSFSLHSRLAATTCRLFAFWDSKRVLQHLTEIRDFIRRPTFHTCLVMVDNLRRLKRTNLLRSTVAVLLGVDGCTMIERLLKWLRLQRLKLIYSFLIQRELLVVQNIRVQELL